MPLLLTVIEKADFLVSEPLFFIKPLIFRHNKFISVALETTTLHFGVVAGFPVTMSSFSVSKFVLIL
jgi:hypothetical protein